MAGRAGGVVDTVYVVYLCLWYICVYTQVTVACLCADCASACVGGGGGGGGPVPPSQLMTPS